MMNTAAKTSSIPVREFRVNLSPKKITPQITATRGSMQPRIAVIVDPAIWMA